LFNQLTERHSKKDDYTAVRAAWQTLAQPLTLSLLQTQTLL